MRFIPFLLVTLLLVSCASVTVEPSRQQVLLPAQCVTLPSGEVVALIGPPEPYPEVIPTAPYPGAFWVSGYWAYRPLGTFWVPGRYWSAAPRSPWVRRRGRKG